MIGMHAACLWLAAECLLMRAGTIVDATIIAAPSSTKNEGRARHSEVPETVAVREVQHLAPKTARCHARGAADTVNVGAGTHPIGHGSIAVLQQEWPISRDAVTGWSQPPVWQRWPGLSQMIFKPRQSFLCKLKTLSIDA